MFALQKFVKLLLLTVNLLSTTKKQQSNSHSDGHMWAIADKAERSADARSEISTQPQHIEVPCTSHHLIHHTEQQQLHQKSSVKKISREPTTG